MIHAQNERVIHKVQQIESYLPSFKIRPFLNVLTPKKLWFVLRALNHTPSLEIRGRLESKVRLQNLKPLNSNGCRKVPQKRAVRTFITFKNELE